MKEASEAQTLQPVDGLAHHGRTDDSEVLVRVENLSKKFCRNLKRSLWYGVQDMTGEVLGRSKKDTLRKDEFWAVKDVNFELRRGECLGLIGHNGAGKSTLLKMLNGLIKPDQGRIEMNGRVGALIELGAGFNPVLTGRENVYINGQILGFSKKEIDEKYDAIVEFAEIPDFMESPVQSYSSGMKVRLGFAIAAQMEPDILIIDEVLAVGDVGFRIKCLNVIHKLLERASVIFVSHSMPQISKISSHILFMKSGKAFYHSKNVSMGIEYYFSDFKDSSNSVRENGLKLNELLFTTGNISKKVESNDLLTINYLDDLTLDFLFKTEIDIEFFGIILRFFDKSLVSIATCQTGKIEYTDRVSITIPKTQFGSGTYSVDLYLVAFREDSSSENIIAYYRNYFTILSSKSKVENHSGIQLHPIIK